MDWVDAAPVVRETYPPYPIDAFGKVARKAIVEAINRVQVPESIVAMNALAAMCVAAQPLIDVELPSGTVRPVSLYLVGQLESVAGKSSAFDCLLGAIPAFDDRLAMENDAAVEVYKREIRTWQVIERGLARQMQKEAAAGRSIGDLEARYAAHLAKQPVVPRKRQTLRAKISQRALHEALEGNREAICALTDEGKTVMGGGLMDEFDVLDGIWSGQRQRMDRGYGKSIVCLNPRLAMLLLVQNGLFDRYERKHGDVARLSGFWGRCLHAAPPSNVGYRVHIAEKDEQALPDFDALIDEFLSKCHQERTAGSLRPEVIRFSEEAADAWMTKRLEIEKAMQPLGALCEIKTFAGRSLEISARIAAIFHFCSKETGLITLNTFERAWKIVEWHMEEFKRIFYEGSAQRVLQRNIEALTGYLKRIGIGIDNFKKNDVLQKGPLKDKARFQPALDVLEQRRMLEVRRVDGTNIIYLDLKHFPDARPRKLFY